jgi:hypothetical protein
MLIVCGVEGNGAGEFLTRYLNNTPEPANPQSKKM